LTVWSNAKITRRVFDKSRALKHQIFTIDGISGDIGGTLATKMKVEFATVQVEVDTGPAGYVTGLIYYISGKNVVVAYTNPADGHTVRIDVWGK
jgi:hypothetical protein